MKIILVSDPGQRTDLMDLVVMDYTSLASEDKPLPIPKSKSPARYVQEVAKKRTRDIVGKFGLKEGKVVGVHTILLMDRHVLKRPLKPEEVRGSLRALSGKTHKVLTGICVLDLATGQVATSYSDTEVTFYELEEKEIREYIDTKEWEGTYGGYDIRGRGGVFVESITGDYYNVSGLPLAKIKRMIRD